jgi:hypothetical protein
MTSAAPLWHLSFDCATKTFAFSLSRVDLSGLAALRARASAAAELLRRTEALLAAGDAAGCARLLATLEPAAVQLEADTAQLVRLADGETVDLFPGRADDSIPTVERIKGVARYVAERVRPAVERHAAGERLRVVVEFQMGPNARARAVAAALIALFAESDTIIVGPSLKNKVATCEAGRYCHFAQKYSTAYSANKAHTIYNFGVIERVFGTSIPETRPASLRGHIADSFMQVLGYLMYGPDEKNLADYF